MGAPKRRNNAEKVTLRQYRDNKSRYLHELEDIVDMYYQERNETETQGLPKLYPLDIIAGLELIKLRFYCRFSTERSGGV